MSDNYDNQYESFLAEEWAKPVEEALDEDDNNRRICSDCGLWNVNQSRECDNCARQFIIPRNRRRPTKVEKETKNCELCNNSRDCYERWFIAKNKCGLKDGCYDSDHHTHWLCNVCIAEIRIIENVRRGFSAKRNDEDRQEREKTNEMYHQAEVVTWHTIEKKEIDLLFKENMRKFFVKKKYNYFETNPEPRHRHFCQKCEKTFSPGQAKVIGDDFNNALITCRLCFKSIARSLNHHIKKIYENIEKFNSEYY
jgi:hypothetical protein